MRIIEVLFEEKEPVRLDVFVSQVADVSRSRAVTLIEDENVLVNGNVANKKTKLNKNPRDLVRLTSLDSVEISVTKVSQSKIFVFVLISK